MKGRNAISCLTGLVLLACSNPPGSSPDSTNQRTDDSSSYVSSDRSFSFNYPLSWEVEELSGNGLEGVLLIAPEVEANWQANMYFEAGSDPEGRDLRQALGDLASNLPATKPGFRLVKIDSISTASSEAGRIAYTHLDAGTTLYSWELIVPTDGGTNRLFVTAATAEDLKWKYLPVFEAVAGSLKFEG